MATALKPSRPAASGEPALRIPPIGANLLPLEVIESRHVRRIRRTVLSLLVVFVALLGGWYGTASYQTSEARGNLANVEDGAQRLLRQQRAYSEVVGVQAETQAIAQQLASLLANDLQWSRLLASLRKVAPPKVQITGVNGALIARGSGAGGGTGSGGAGGGTVASQLPDASGEKSIGTLTITGSGGSKADVAAYVDALARVSGVGSPLLGDANQLESGGVQFTVRLDITSSALGGRYTAKTSTGAGKQ